MANSRDSACGNTAVIYVAPPGYPPPTANGQYRSSGCGTAVNSQISVGGASTAFTGTGPDGYLRTFNIHVPSSYNINNAAPLIMVFHGRGDSGTAVESGTGYSLERINPYGIAVYPTAVKDSTGQPTWQGDPSYVGNNTINDMGFVQALIANISSQYCIDTSRIFAAGFSNGGGLVNVMACDPTMSTVFNAFGPHSGAYYTQTGDSNTVCFPNTVTTNDLVHSVCSPSRRVPMVEFHGDGDGTIPYFGGGRRGYCLPAIPHWSQDWATRNNLTTDNVTTVSNGGNVTRAEFGSLSGLLGLVTQFRLANWPHQYSLGTNGGYIDAAALSLNFFYKWTNPAGPSQDYLSSIYASTSTPKPISCPSTLSITTTTTTFTTTSSTSASSASSSSTPSITSASSLITAAPVSGSGTPTTSASAVSVSGSAVSTSLNGYPVYTTTPSCPGSNGTYYYDPYVGDSVNGLYYFIMCGYDITSGAKTNIAASTWQQCFSICDNYPTCTSFTFSAGTCFIKRVNAAYVYSGGDYVQASQNPVRANLVTQSGVVVTTTTTTASNSVSSTYTGPVVSQTSYACPANDQQAVVDPLR
ncbi:hypothetical protein E4T48_08034 [Aureobasidium sp. EXF-10727]|nr:hypothetical protein E4T48_08034 [Aureobasidium sp. EXF-10727]